MVFVLCILEVLVQFLLNLPFVWNYFSVDEFLDCGIMYPHMIHCLSSLICSVFGLSCSKREVDGKVLRRISAAFKSGRASI